MESKAGTLASAPASWPEALTARGPSMPQCWAVDFVQGCLLSRGSCCNITSCLAIPAAQIDTTRRAGREDLDQPVQSVLLGEQGAGQCAGDLFVVRRVPPSMLRC